MKEESINPNTSMWDIRYKNKEYAYGKNPNKFFKECIQNFEPKAILMPADGEGRNGVFAAQLGWCVTSFDLSLEGRTKALALAEEKGVSIEYLVEDLEELEFKNESFDAIGLIYAHFPAHKKSLFHKKLNTFLKPGGLIILEAFSKKHLKLNSINPKVGGPKEVDMLFSIEEISDDFEGYHILILKETEILLNEGNYHHGIGSVIRFMARKPF